MSECGKVKIAVLVSGGGTNLGALISAQNEGIIKSGEIVAVISDREGVYALTRAENAGIPHETLVKKSFPSQQAFDDALDKVLTKYQAEVIVLAGFLSILGEGFTKKYDKRIINVHPSLIPSFCGKGFYGLRVHEYALARGVKLTGATVHFVNEIPDGGEIIMQKAVTVEEGDTPEVLQRRVMEQAEWIILPLSVEKVCADKAKK